MTFVQGRSWWPELRPSAIERAPPQYLPPIPGYHRTDVRSELGARAHRLWKLCVHRVRRPVDRPNTKSRRLGLLPGLPVRLEDVDY